MAIKVGLFVTCLVDFHRPSIAFASIKILESAGCIVEVPEQQTCCGQPAYNNGDQNSTRLIAKQVIKAFESFDYCVAPSGSCLAMIKVHYPELFKNDPKWYQRALSLSKRCFEMAAFLHDELQYFNYSSQLNGKLTYHDSCSGLRELKLYNQPRKLLSHVENLELIELEDNNVCCGFGGTFSVKFSDISGNMVDQKCQKIIQTGASYIAAGDLGCLLNIAGRLKRLGSKIKAYHWVEILAGIEQEAI